METLHMELEVLENLLKEAVEGEWYEIAGVVLQRKIQIEIQIKSEAKKCLQKYTTRIKG